MLYFKMQRQRYCLGIQTIQESQINRRHNRSMKILILLPNSSLPIPEPRTVTPISFPTSRTPTHSGVTSPSNLTHRTASSFPIGFLNDICRCCTNVGIVNDTCVTRDLAVSAPASSLQCFFEDTARLSSTGAISGRRWRADFFARVSEDGGRGRVDWWSCLAFRREKRSVERAVVFCSRCWEVDVAFAVLDF